MSQSSSCSARNFYFFKLRGGIPALFLLTARRYGGAALFLQGVYFLFFLILVLSVTERRLPLGQVLLDTLNHENCNVYSPKPFGIIHEIVSEIVCFIVCKIYFVLVLSKRSIGSKELTCKNVQKLHDS